MPNLNELVNRTDIDDEASEWAIVHEFELRFEKYKVAKLGILGAMQKMNELLLGLDRVATLSSER